jgi:hypothetical protein
MKPSRRIRIVVKTISRLWQGMIKNVAAKVSVEISPSGAMLNQITTSLQRTAPLMAENALAQI